MKEIAKWAYRNWNVAFFLVTVFFFFIYAIAFQSVGTWITWEDFSHSWYSLYIFSFPLAIFVHIIAVVNKQPHRFKCLLGTFFLWFFIQGITVGAGV